MSSVLPIAYLNGAFVAIEKASVSVLDRGFLFGDGIYEVVPYADGQSLLLDEHLARLARSLRETGIENLYTHSEWRALLNELALRNGGGNQAVYVQVTRGADDHRDHAFPVGVRPTVFAMSSALGAGSHASGGVAAITAPDIRWGRCDIKSTSLQANCMLRQHAVSAGAVETILLRDGQALEGAASSLLVVHQNRITTTPDSHAILPGTTRDLVRTLAVNDDMHYAITSISEAGLRAADEIWLASATRALLPVTQLDGNTVGNGRPGPVWLRMMKLFEAYKNGPPRQ